MQGFYSLQSSPWIAALDRRSITCYYDVSSDSRKEKLQERILSSSSTLWITYIKLFQSNVISHTFNHGEEKTEVTWLNNVLLLLVKSILKKGHYGRSHDSHSSCISLLKVNICWLLLVFIVEEIISFLEISYQIFNDMRITILIKCLMVLRLLMLVLDF